MQRWNGDADIEDILVGAVGRRRSGDWGEWRPGTGKPGGLQSMGSHGVRHD